MPLEKSKEHKCSHHTATSNRSRWDNFHFSGKVIMCSVLFGLGLTLIGSILMAIGMEHNDDNKSEDTNTLSNKAPMSIVGPIIIGIGGFTVVAGIIMCLFETNICKKNKDDSRPLIEEQTANATASKTTDPVSSQSQKRKKHRHHRKSAKNSEISDSSLEKSPHSKPIEVLVNSSSREFTASENFLTPSSSFIPETIVRKPDVNNTLNQTTAALMKSFTSSGKSWNTSTEFQTPCSSPQDSSGSFEVKRTEDYIDPSKLKVPFNDGDQQNGFHSPMNSYIEDMTYSKENVESNSEHSHENPKKFMDSEKGKNTDSMESSNEIKIIPAETTVQLDIPIEDNTPIVCEEGDKTATQSTSLHNEAEENEKQLQSNAERADKSDNDVIYTGTLSNETKEPITLNSSQTSHESSKLESS